MQVGWVESIPGGPKGLGHVHTNRQNYPDMTVKSLVGNRASYQRINRYDNVYQQYGHHGSITRSF